MNESEPGSVDPAPRISVGSSIFDGAALATWLDAEFDLGGALRCRLAAQSMNDTYRVTTARGEFYLRVTPRGWRTRDEIVAELAFIRALDVDGVRVGTPVSRRDGEAVSTLAAPEGERLAVLFTAVPGSDVANVGIAQSRAYGRLAARIHQVADAMPLSSARPEIGVERLLDEPLAAIRETFGADTGDVRYLETIASRVRAELERLPCTGPMFGMCHGDLHPGNVRFDERGLPALFDFDLAGRGWRIYDLTVFVWNAFGERRPRRWRDSRWNAFLLGYQETRPFDAAALEAVPLFLVAREMWLMGADCRGQVGWPVQWLTPHYLADTAARIRTWEAEYAVLRG